MGVAGSRSRRGLVFGVFNNLINVRITVLLRLEVNCGRGRVIGDFACLRDHLVVHLRSNWRNGSQVLQVGRRVRGCCRSRLICGARHVGVRGRDREVLQIIHTESGLILQSRGRLVRLSRLFTLRLVIQVLQVLGLALLESRFVVKRESLLGLSRVVGLL